MQLILKFKHYLKEAIQQIGEVQCGHQNYYHKKYCYDFMKFIKTPMTIWTRSIAKCKLSNLALGL